MSLVTVNVNRSEVHSIHDTASLHLRKSGTLGNIIFKIQNDKIVVIQIQKNLIEIWVFSFRTQTYVANLQ